MWRVRMCSRSEFLFRDLEIQAKIPGKTVIDSPCKNYLITILYRYHIVIEVEHHAPADDVSYVYSYYAIHCHINHKRFADLHHGTALYAAANNTVSFVSYNMGIGCVYGFASHVYPDWAVYRNFQRISVQDI